MADHEILVIARKLRMDLTAHQAKVSELITLAAQLEAPDPESRLCPECRLSAGSLPQGMTLADHRYRAHEVEATEPNSGSPQSGSVVKQHSLKGASK